MCADGHDDLQSNYALELVRKPANPPGAIGWVTTLSNNYEAHHVYAICECSVVIYDTRTWNILSVILGW